MKKYLDKIAEIKKNFDDISERVGDFNISDEAKKKFKEYGVVLDEAKNDLEAKRYFICTLGSVKAGKSTLINALCQKDVCIDAPAKETTKLPSIIKSVRNKSEEGIYFYQFARAETVNNSENDEQKTSLSDEQETSLSELMSAMIRDSDCSKINGVIRSKKYTLSKDNLMYLTTDSGVVSDCPNPFLAEINFCPSGDFFLTCKDGTPVAIIDMPGLDGIVAGMKRNPAIELIASRCPRLFLVQSSMSATNETCLEAFNTLRSKHSSVHVSVVFNKVEAMEWHTDVAQKEHFDSISVKVKEELKKHGIHIDQFLEINLYKAKDSSGNYEYKWASGNDADSLRRASNINELIEHVKTLDPDDMRIDRAKDSIESLYTNFDKHFDELKKALAAQKEKFNEEKEGFIGQIDKLKQAKEKDLTCYLNIDLTDELENTWNNIWKAEYQILDKIKQDLERCKDDMKKLCEMTRTRLIDSKNTLSVSSPKVAEKLVDCVKEVLKKRFTEELNGKIDEKYFAGDLFDDALNGKIKEFVETITKSAPDIAEYCENLPDGWKQFLDKKADLPLLGRICKKKYDLEYFKNFIDGYSGDVKSHIEDAQKDVRGQKMSDFYKHIFDGSGIVKDLENQRDERIKAGVDCECIIKATGDLKRQAEKLKECVDNEKC